MAPTEDLGSGQEPQLGHLPGSAFGQIPSALWVSASFSAFLENGTRTARLVMLS